MVFVLLFGKLRPMHKIYSVLILEMLDRRTGEITSSFFLKKISNFENPNIDFRCVIFSSAVNEFKLINRHYFFRFS
jgi:hypothetical protein